MNDLFRISTPIFQAPTGSIAGAELAIAVSTAGGMGAMALTWKSPAEASELVREVRSRTALPFMVNFALAFEPISLPAALESGAPFVTFSWGDAEPYISKVHHAGARCGVQVTNPAGAKRAQEIGADFLICQGVEAGGHVQSNRSLWELLPMVIEAADGLPVLAAGGIADAANVKKSLEIGAAGAVVGTRFVASLESLAHPEYKRRLTENPETALTICFDGSWPYAAHRVVRNSTLETWEAAGSPRIGARPGENEIVGTNAAGEPIARYADTAPRIGMEGNIEAMCLYSGTGVGSIKEILSAADIIHALTAF